MFSLVCRAAPIVRISSEVTSVWLLSLIFSRPLYRKLCVLLLLSLNLQEVLPPAKLNLSSWACYFLIPLEHPLITRASLSLAVFPSFLPLSSSQSTSSAYFSLTPSAVQEVGFWFRGLGGRTNVCLQRWVCAVVAVFPKGKRQSEAYRS